MDGPGARHTYNLYNLTRPVQCIYIQTFCRLPSETASGWSWNGAVPETRAGTHLIT